jgi:DNA-binding MarR family transcriptional regulator
MPPESLGRAIMLISRHLQAMITLRLEAHHLTASHLPFLLAIARREGISQDELSVSVHADKATTSKVVKKLVEEGYVQKNADPRDRRFARLWLTDRGGAALPAIRQILDDTTTVLAAGFTQEEAQQARALLPRMLANIAQHTATMTTERQFHAHVEALKASVQALPDVSDDARIQRTAARLTGLHFTPTLMLPTDGFVYFSKSDLLAEIDRVAAFTADEVRNLVATPQDTREIQREHLNLLGYHFMLLTRLRLDDAQAWDEIDELYGDD